MLLVTAALLGVASHVSYYRLHAPTLRSSGLLAVAAIALASALPDQYDGQRTLALGAFCAALFAAIVVHRFACGPLRLLKGPRSARLTLIWRYRLMLRGEQGQKLLELHRLYGPVVRYGPSHVSVILADSISAIHALDKGDMYAYGYGHPGLLRVVKASEHRGKRAIWSAAFTPAALASYQPVVERRCLELMASLERSAGQPIDIQQFTTRFAFDVISSVAFSAETDATTSDRYDEVISVSRLAPQRIAALGGLPAVGAVLQWMMLNTPWLFNNSLATARKFIDFGRQAVEKRLAADDTNKDIFSCPSLRQTLLTHADMIDETRKTVPLKPEELLTHSMLAIAAGVDTTTVTLTIIHCLLIAYPDVRARMLEELDQAFSDQSELDPRTLASLPYLNGVINEAMRLLPFLSSGSERKVGPEPLVLSDGTVLPPGTTVTVPHLALHRSEAYFDQPDDFLPERWLKDSQLKCDRRAFIPFSYGRANCVGSKLAQAELRLVLATTYLRYEVNPSEGFDARLWLSSVREYFGTTVDPLMVVITPRVR